MLRALRAQRRSGAGSIRRAAPRRTSPRSRRTQFPAEWRSARNKRIGLLAAVALIAGCSGGSQPALAPGPATNAARFGADPLHLHGGLDAFAAVRPYGPLHRDRRKSWISPDAKRSPRLMFASDSEHGDVYIYSLPDMKLKGTLTGFYEPQGLCSDPRGNVYVANTDDTQVLNSSRETESCCRPTPIRTAIRSAAQSIRSAATSP